MKILRFICRVIIGLVFIFSGTVKAIDPLGSVYKFREYFHAFHLEFLQPLSLTSAFILCSAEFLAGITILTCYRQKTGIWMALMLMIIFTPVTLVLALTNPVSDCGCFGDAIHLTNWQTFGKNLILIFLVIFLFTGRNKVTSILKPALEWTIIVITVGLFVLFSFLNLRYLPITDFLPYKTGVNIQQSMKMPEGKPADKYRTTFIYEKEGLKKEFTIENFPSNDSSWKFINQKSVLIFHGYKPPIHDFSITSLDGENLTDTILNEKGYTLLMVSKKLKEAEDKHLRNGFELGSYCRSNGVHFYVLTSSDDSEIRSFGNESQFSRADETILKTMVRANPGYLLLKDGTITGKWSWANLPSKELFIKETSKDQGQKLNHHSYLLYLSATLLSVILSLLLISSFSYKRRGSSDI